MIFQPRTSWRLRAIRKACLLAAVGMLVGYTGVAGAAPSNGNYCPGIFEKGVLPLNFNPAFLHVDTFDNDQSGSSDDLLMSSFFNSIKDPSGENVIGFFERDLVARIRDLDSLDPDTFDADTDVEELTDLDGGAPVHVWPNDTERVPNGMLPFEGVVSPQGFHTAPEAGRLSIIDVSDPNRTEYVVDQTFQIPGPPCTVTGVIPKFYHKALFFDMDNDGLKDIITVRSSFKVNGLFCPPTGDLVWFKNPGNAINPNTEWQETVLYGFPTSFNGPDIAIAMADFENDGIPEFVATSFFTVDVFAGQGAIRIYGAPVGQDWSTVNQFSNPPRNADISDDQGLPFGVELVDLNLDGKLDVLATNHQPDNCAPGPRSSEVPGRIYALEQPADGDLFNSDWITHVLLDDIRPNPTFPTPASETGFGRLAPNTAKAFWPFRHMEGNSKPYIVAGGDEASKVWVLQPVHATNSKKWDYKSAVIFDINDHYGPNTTQTLLDDPQGVSISTIGGLAVRYDDPGPNGQAEFYVPVFEAKEIHVFGFRASPPFQTVDCPEDVQIACPVE